MNKKIGTLCVHPENEKEGDCREHFGALSYPIYQSATFAHNGVGRSTGYDYSRTQNPTREQVEIAVAKLEGGIDALAFSTGMAAIALVMELFKAGDHIIADAGLYGGSIRLFDNVSSKNGIEVMYIDCSKDDPEPLIKENTKAFFIETPTNPMMNVVDIKKYADIAKRHNLLLIVDNTFLSPYFQKPLDLGADIVIHSGTKYLGGHNDTLAGFVVTSKDRKEVAARLRYLMNTTGATLAPFDAWLILRGLKTLAIRMEKSQENAIKIAEWIKDQKLVTNVYYPGLEDHPGHDLMKKQASGFGAMLTFQMVNKEAAHSVLEKVKIIAFAESLGGVESLITYPTTQTHADVPEDVRIAMGITDSTLRLSVGIEDADDLIADLDQAFKRTEEEINA